MNRPWRPLAVVLCVLLAGAASLRSQPGPPAGRVPPPVFADPLRVAKLEGAFPDIDRLFRAFAGRSRVPGIAYGIVIDGRLAHSGAIGYRDIATKDPVDVDTVFRIASMTKSFSALCVMRLRDEGRLSLDDPAERYVPELAGLVYPTADSPRVTIRHLLSHAEGFPEDNPWGDRQLAVTDDQMAAMMRSGIPFSTVPGTAYEYSNYGFAILGRIVARVSGMPYREYVETYILRPLGMSATTLEAADVPPSRLAHGYRMEEDTGWVEEPPLPHGAFGSMGGMLTSTRDLAAYVAFLSSAWPPRDDPDTGPVRRASVREMQQVWRPSPASVSRQSVDAPLRLNAGGYGFGLRVCQTCGSPHLVSHGGGLPGFGSHMRWLPEHGVAIVAMGNLTYTSWGRVVDEAIEAFDRTGAEPRVPQPSAALLAARETINRLIERWDDSAARAMAAENLYLDAPMEGRRRMVEAIRTRFGACRADQGFEAENALRGTWKMTCDRGFLRVGITLAPTVPPRVQNWDITPIRPLPPPVDAAVKSLAGMIGAPDRGALANLLEPGTDADAAHRQIGAASAWGVCQPGEVLSGGGDRNATVRLSCTKGPLDLTVDVNPSTGKIRRLLLAPSGIKTCVP